MTHSNEETTGFQTLGETHVSQSCLDFFSSLIAALKPAPPKGSGWSQAFGFPFDVVQGFGQRFGFA
jgi:hypothetical protein